MLMKWPALLTCYDDVLCFMMKGLCKSLEFLWFVCLVFVCSFYVCLELQCRLIFAY